MTGSWDEVVASLAAANGRTASAATLGEYAALTVELVDPKKRGVAGRSRLAVSGAEWRLENANTVMAASADEGDDLPSRVSALEGRVLLSVTVERPSLSARFRFEGGLHLLVFSVYSHDVEHWTMDRPDGTSVTFGPGSAWSISGGDEV